MRTENIEKKLADELRDETPDVLESILARCTPQEEQEDAVVVPIAAASGAKRGKWVKAVYAAAAMLLLFVGGYFGVGQYRQAYAAEYSVTLEAGASVRLEVSKTDRVVSAVGLDAKGKASLEAAQSGGELKGQKLNAAVDAVVTAMAKDGTISDQSAILVTVDGADKSENDAVKAEVSAEVSNSLKQNGVTASVLAQVLVGSGELAALAEKYGVSEGRAALIQQTAENEPGLDESELAKLELGALAALTKDGGAKVTAKVSVAPSSAASAYVSADAAAKSACAKANVSIGGGAAADVSAEITDGKLVYRVEVKLPGGSAECQVDAKTGEILNWVESAVSAAVNAAGGLGTGAPSAGTAQTGGTATSSPASAAPAATAPASTAPAAASPSAGASVKVDVSIGDSSSIVQKVHDDVTGAIDKARQDLKNKLNTED